MLPKKVQFTLLQNALLHKSLFQITNISLPDFTRIPILLSFYPFSVQVIFTLCICIYT